MILVNDVSKHYCLLSMPPLKTSTQKESGKSVLLLLKTLPTSPHPTTSKTCSKWPCFGRFQGTTTISFVNVWSPAVHRTTIEV